MDSITICKNNINSETIVLDIKSAHEDNGILVLELNKKFKDEEEHYNKCDVTINDIVYLRRYVTNEQLNSLVNVSEYKANVIDISVNDEGYFEFYINAPEDLSLHVNLIEEIDGFYKINLFNDSKLYAQDLIVLSGLSFYYKDINTNEKYDLFGIEDVYFEETVSNEPIATEVALFKKDFQTTYNECDGGVVVDVVLTPDYYYIPSYLTRNSIFVSLGSIIDNLDEKISYIYAPFNEYYYKDENDKCIFWNELSVEQYNEIGYGLENSEEGIKYIEKDKEIEINSISQVVHEKFYFRFNIGFEKNSDYTHLHQEENVSNLFTEKVKKMVVEEAPVIDMEKVKFSPYINDKMISQLTFNLHFRTRIIDETWRYDNNTDVDYWNGIRDYGDITNDNKNVELSDMLYYLGFTDNDVKNQKSKLKKSFLRLSFYDDTDPLTQKLLYYSTVYVDTGELFGKYVKAREKLIKSGYTIPDVVLESSAIPENRLDARFVIKDEFNTEKSSEGFNIYYFPSDVLESMQTENSGKTIYMKVEFNHAGFGRTIPFIHAEDLSGLSLSNYKERLYIPLKLKYIDNKYIYEIIDGENLKPSVEINDSIITFNLFEPRLTK